MTKIIVAIDGFSSCGKSTMAKDLAREIAYLYVDSGAMYRAVTFYAMQNGLINDSGKLDEKGLEAKMSDINVEFRLNPEAEFSETYLNGVNVEHDIRGMEVSNNVSMVSVYSFVRSFIDASLHKMSESKGVVMDGRDIGTAVFPNAELKIFVTAKPEIRAQRRLDELRRKGDETTTFEEVFENLKQRDYTDQNRAESPLQKAEDAIELDNSEMTVDEQMQWLLERFDDAVNENERKKKVEIDKKSGFCFGVVNAIKKAEEELAKGGVLYCLGDIVHNNLEVDRLEKLGLKTINHDEFEQLRNARVLLRAHGEPPATYEIARKNNIEIIDASCPVVLRLQKRIHDKYEQESDNKTQIVIYGKKGHAEVKGLLGQTDSNAIVIEGEDDLDILDFSRNICLFSQTTKPLDGFGYIIEVIKKRMIGDAKFDYYDTICRQVSNRMPNIKEFALKNDIILFVAGKKSSNGQVLFEECKKHNPRSYFISSASELDVSLIDNDLTVGVCGATSTPKWQMEEVEAKVNEIRRTR